MSRLRLIENPMKKNKFCFSSKIVFKNKYHLQEFKKFKLNWIFNSKLKFLKKKVSIVFQELNYTLIPYMRFIWQKLY